MVIDDLFERMDHFEGRRGTIEINNPVIKDRTEEVLRNKQEFRDDATIPEGTRYFGFYDPEMQNVEYRDGTSKSGHNVRTTHQAAMYDQKEDRLSIWDKVAQRELSDKWGVFDNPRYLDTRKLFSSQPRSHNFVVAPEEFTDFPIDEIVENLGSEGLSYIFGNTVDGFRIRNSKQGGYTVSSQNPVVREADSETKKIQDPKERMEAFLDYLTHNNFQFNMIGSQSHDGSRDELIDAVLAHPTNLYVKGARSGGGYLVVRVGKENGDTVIESDSPQLAEMRKKRNSRAERMENHYLSLENLPEFMRQMFEEDIQNLKEPAPKSELYSIFDRLSNPIIEEEIPFDLYEGQRTEFRIICQAAGPRDEPRFNITSYAKVSDNGVSANISLGGHGEEVKTVLESIYKARGVDDPATAATDTEIELLVKANQFANNIYSHYGELLGEDARPPSDFAIDVVPSWNESTGKLDLYFLEINHGYGYKGLKSIDPERARTVSQAKTENVIRSILALAAKGPQGGTYNPNQSGRYAIRS